MAPKKRSPTTTSTAPTATLALSELHLRADALEKDRQKLLKQIKKKRTELNNFVEQMREVATQVVYRSAPSIQKMKTLDVEIHQLFDKILNTRKLGKQTKRYVLEVYRTLQMSGLISPNITEEEIEETFNELSEPNEEEDPFSQNYTASDRPPFVPPPQENTRTEESRNIRQIFLRLAEIFHPDKVTDSENQIRHTEIMKEINKAYQEKDLAKLLEIEQQHLAGELTDNFNEDDLTRKCNQIEKQNVLLKKQYESLKKELRFVKKTPEGSLVSDYRQVTKLGIDFMEQILAHTEKQVTIVTEIRDFVQDFLDKKITAQQFRRGPDCLYRMERDLEDELLEEIFDI